MIHQSKQARPNCHGDEAIPVRFKDRLYWFKKFVLSISGCMNDIGFDPVGLFVRIISTKSVSLPAPKLGNITSGHHFLWSSMSGPVQDMLWKGVNRLDPISSFFLFFFSKSRSPAYHIEFASKPKAIPWHHCTTCLFVSKTGCKFRIVWVCAPNFYLANMFDSTPRMLCCTPSQLQVLSYIFKHKVEGRKKHYLFHNHGGHRSILHSMQKSKPDDSNHSLTMMYTYAAASVKSSWRDWSRKEPGNHMTVPSRS